MKFCKNCGRVIGDNEQCTCGLGANAADPQQQMYSAPQQYPQTQQFGGYPQGQPAGIPQMSGYPQQAAAKPGRKTGIILILTALLLAAGLGVWTVFFRTAGYEKPVEQLFKGINSRNFKTCCDAWVTDYMYQSLADYSFDGDISACRNSFNEYCTEMKDEMQDFFAEREDDWDVKNIKYSYSIEGKSKLSSSDLRDIEEDTRFFYRDSELKEGYELEVTVTVKSSGGSDSAKGYLIVVRGRDGWKLVPDYNDGFSFSEFKDAEEIIEACLDF